MYGMPLNKVEIRTMSERSSFQFDSTKFTKLEFFTKYSTNRVTIFHLYKNNH